MEKKYDVVALGELLIDFTDNGVSEQGNPVMEANPGGAPCNVLAMLEKLGRRTAFIGKVGKDMFGSQLKDALIEVGISTEGLVMDETVHTTLAFVHTSSDGDRDFSFYRKPGADMMLSKDDVKVELVENAKIFHYGSISMTDDISETATKFAIETAKEAGAFLTFDPNLREPLWDTLEHAREQIAYGMSQCNLLKISDNEILWFTGKDDYEEGIQEIKRLFPNIELILLSLGKEGSRAYTKQVRVEVPAFLRDNTVETTGAGDTFCGNAINYVLGWIEQGIRLSDLKEDDLIEMLTFANKAASIITTRKGALRVMPSLDEIY